MKEKKIWSKSPAGERTWMADCLLQLQARCCPRPIHLKGLSDPKDQNPLCQFPCPGRTRTLYTMPKIEAIPDRNRFRPTAAQPGHRP